MWSKREWAKTPRNETIPSWSTCSDVIGNQCICQRLVTVDFMIPEAETNKFYVFLCWTAHIADQHFCRRSASDTAIIIIICLFHPKFWQPRAAAPRTQRRWSGCLADTVSWALCSIAMPKPSPFHSRRTGRTRRLVFFDWKKCFANPLTVVSSFIQICPCTARIPGFGLLSFEVWGASVEFWP